MPPLKLNNANDAEFKQRKQRGRTEPIYLINTHSTDSSNNDLFRKYDVMGKSGNLYTVNISNTCNCSCPDYIIRRNRCKHIFFILNKVMKVTDDDENTILYTPDKLSQMFNNIPNITLLLNSHLINTTINNNNTISYNNLHKCNIKPIDDDDLCPICLSSLMDSPTVYCRYSCGKHIHRECFDMYHNHLSGTSKKKSKNNVNNSIMKCVYCRADWNKNDEVKKKSSTSNFTYINLMENLQLNDTT